MATQMDLEALSWDALLSQKEDLQARLARFQQAFHQKHGRNPAGEELSPAKPAIKRYRAVCKEISLREQEAAQLYAAQQTAAGVPKYLQKSKGGGEPIGELAANGAQSAAMTSNIAVSGGAVERAMTRAQTGRIAAGADERGASAAGAAGGANTGAMQASVDGMQAGGAGASGGGLGFSDLLPSTATVELIANGLQYMQLSYTLLAQVRGKGRVVGARVGGGGSLPAAARPLEKPSGAARAPGAAGGRSPTGGRARRRARGAAGWWRPAGMRWCWRSSGPRDPTAEAAPPA